MHPARPQVQSLPCPACGEPVDPLRAREVLCLEQGVGLGQDGFRYLCGPECRSRFLHGERTHERKTPPRTQRISVPDMVREATRPRLLLDRDSSETAARRAVFAPEPVPVPWAGVGAAAAGLMLGSFPFPLALGALSAALTIVAAGTALHASRAARTEVGLLPWALGPMGAMLAAVAALLARAESDNAWPLAGAAIAAAAMLARAWLDARARQPVAEVVSELSRPMPAVVRVPVQDNALEVHYEEIPTHRVRAGEQVMALEGEVAAVDGIVQAGQAEVLLYPDARTPVLRQAGDSLLAGARIVSGAVRLGAARVGDERALIRPARFGDGEGHGAAPIAKLAHRVAGWGGVAAAGGALAGLALAGAPSFAGQLSAAAAVLLAAPLLSVRRSAEAPLIAAGAAAAERGIVFSSAHALEMAGRSAVAAMCTRGTVTDGNPEVVEVHPIGETTAATVVALAAAAEAAAAGHPIARAIQAYARASGIEPANVRRATSLAGRGVTAIGPAGESLVIGNRQLLLDEGVSIALADAEATHAEERGYTALFLGVGGRVRGVFALSDSIRVGARAAVQRVFDMGVEVVLLSGDHRVTVECLAEKLDVAHVKAELLPNEQGAEVVRLREAGGAVAVVGHPDRDSSALAEADVPIVLRAAGGPHGERGVALSTDDVRDAAAALWIARAARSEARRGAALAVGVGCALVAGAALGSVVPAVAALLSVAVDSYTLPAGARLLRRIELRVPARA